MSDDKMCDLMGHIWYKPEEGVVACRVCDVVADEFVLGLRADEAVGNDHE